MAHRREELALRDVGVFGSLLGMPQLLRDTLLLFKDLEMLVETDDHVGQLVVVPGQRQRLQESGILVAQMTESVRYAAHRLDDLPGENPRQQGESDNADDQQGRAGQDQRIDRRGQDALGLGHDQIVARADDRSFCQHRILTVEPYLLDVVFRLQQAKEGRRRLFAEHAGLRVIDELPVVVDKHQGQALRNVTSLEIRGKDCRRIDVDHQQPDKLGLPGRRTEVANGANGDKHSFLRG